MTQRWIEIVIGKLVTDADVRRRFIAAPHATLLHLVEQGVDLTSSEIAALLAIDTRLWERTAAHIQIAPSDANPISE